jgi:hypothetical protein
LQEDHEDNLSHDGNNTMDVDSEHSDMTEEEKKSNQQIYIIY